MTDDASPDGAASGIQSPSGLEQDGDAFLALTEIDMIAKAAKRAFERQLPRGLTTAQFGVLNRLARLGDPHETIGELATAFDVAQPTMTSTIGKLADKGLVALVRDPGDGRRRIVQLTEAGLSLRNRVSRQVGPITEGIEGVDWAVLARELHRLRLAIMERGLTGYKR